MEILSHMKTYRAPWGKSLIWASVLVTVICVGATGLTSSLLAGFKNPGLAGLVWLPVLIPFGCLPFVIRSYTITDDAILIKRLFWNTRLDRSSLMSAEVEPKAMRGSIRTFGNGGGFSITGWYWNKRLRAYRAFVTDLNRTVILRFRTRTVVISPDEPGDFVKTLGLAEAGGAA